MAMTMTAEELSLRVVMMRKHLEALYRLHASSTVIDSARQALEALERSKRDVEPATEAAERAFRRI